MWRGIHNISKTKALLVLYDRKHHKKDNSGLGVLALHRLSGVDYDYLRTKLSTWCRWNYLSRSPVESKGRAIWAYTIATKGERFIESVPREVLQRCVAEIRASRTMAVGKSGHFPNKSA